VAYVIHANERAEDRDRNARKVELAPAADWSRIVAEPHVVLANTALGEEYGKVAVVPLDDVRAPRAVSSLSCDRVDVAADRGVCLQSDRGVVTTYHAVIVDRRMHELRRFDLVGAPSRVRVSPDGRWAGITVFVTGHSYADLDFSTQTNIVDLRTGEILPDLEQFTVRKDGDVVTAIDRNYWGVTFVPGSDAFYATLQTGGSIYLMKGDISTRSGNVIADDVECPSLSPDGTRIAFKQRTGGSGISAVAWHLAVLDLASGRRVRLAESKSVDDQAEWADNDTVVYGLPASASGSAETDVWAVRADGSGTPRRWISRAWSPSVARGTPHATDPVRGDSRHIASYTPTDLLLHGD
jgi:hypothetical protein